MSLLGVVHVSFSLQPHSQDQYATTLTLEQERAVHDAKLDVGHVRRAAYVQQLVRVLAVCV